MQQAIEAIGYLATVLVASSFLTRSMVRLRALNVAGSGIFIFYGLMVESYPIALLNTFICVVNVFQLLALYIEGRKS